jgi:hypothetical protein
MWNINKHRQRTNNAVEGLNSKLNSIIWKQQPKGRKTYIKQEDKVIKLWKNTINQIICRNV